MHLLYEIALCARMYNISQYKVVYTNSMHISESHIKGAQYFVQNTILVCQSFMCKNIVG
jgi:hypothetical protein